MAISRRMLLERFAVGAAAAVTRPELAEGWSDTRGPRGPIRLHRNESAYGPSPNVIAAVRDSLSDTACVYPDESAETLRRTIADRHRVTPDRVVLGCGSSDILRMAVDAFAGPHKTIVAARPTFESIGELAERAGARVVDVPLSKDYSHDLAGMLARCDEATGLVYICNPNNPSGSLTPRRDLEAFLRKLPRATVAIVDEAYHDYIVESPEYESFIDRPLDDERVVVTRSFSKIHGLAGLRVGYAIAAGGTARTLSSHRLADGVNSLAARAAAAALIDRDHVRTAVTRNLDDRQEFLNQANARMLRSVDSLTNFVMLNTARPAPEAIAHLAKHGILVSGPIPGFDNYVRVSIGPAAAMREFWRVWDLLPHKMAM